MGNLALEITAGGGKDENADPFHSAQTHSPKSGDPKENFQLVWA